MIDRLSFTQINYPEANFYESLYSQVPFGAGMMPKSPGHQNCVQKPNRLFGSGTMNCLIFGKKISSFQFVVYLLSKILWFMNKKKPIWGICKNTKKRFAWPLHFKKWNEFIELKLKAIWQFGSGPKNQSLQKISFTCCKLWQIFWVTLTIQNLSIIWFWIHRQMQAKYAEMFVYFSASRFHIPCFSRRQD